MKGQMVDSHRGILLRRWAADGRHDRSMRALEYVVDEAIVFVERKIHQVPEISLQTSAIEAYIYDPG